jgi:hypothetical protein
MRLKELFFKRIKLPSPWAIGFATPSAIAYFLKKYKFLSRILFIRKNIVFFLSLLLIAFEVF